MAIDLGTTLPPLLRERLTGARAGVGDLAVPVCTVDAEGFPHPAMVSYAELASEDAASLEVSIHETSRTARYLRERGVLTLVFIDPAMTCYVKARATTPPRPHPTTPAVLVFGLAVAGVLVDRTAAHEAPAVVTSGITFARVGESR